MISREKLQLIDIEFKRKKKDTLTAYIFLVFLWFIGLHKFYIGRTIEGIIYIVSVPISLIFSIYGFFNLDKTFLLIGVSFGTIIGMFLLLDVITLWKQVEKANDKIYKDIFEKIAGYPYDQMIYQ
jgi:TM2 domain-containing membrane protein YozV